MKLVFLSHDSNHTGGAQKCLVDLFKGLKCKHPHCEIYVIFPSEGELIETCMPYINGYKVISMPWWLLDNNRVISFRKQVSFVFKTIKRVMRVVRYLRLIKPDYAITNTIVLPYLALSCRILSVKHIWFIHEIPTTWGDRKFVFSLESIFKFIDFFSLKVVVPSNFAKSFYAQAIAINKIDVITQAVDLDMSCSSVQVEHKRYTILLVGTFDSNKGQLELLQAVKTIVSSGRDINCYLLGSDSGYLSTCEKFVSTNKLEDYVTIAPFTNDVYTYYLLADVLVVCSGFETFGRVVVEAQKCGLPAILSNVGANLERIQDGVNGLLYEKGKIDDLVCKIEILRDRRKRDAFVRQVKHTELDKYSLVSFASQFYDLLK